MHVEINEEQRAELLAAVIERKATIASHVKKLTADTMPTEAALAEKRLSLYTTQTGAAPRVGLVAMFSLAPDLDEERVKAGEPERDPEGQQDIFGGGSETGGGHPAGAVEYVGAFGKLYPTQEAADASFRTGPDPEDIAAARDPEAPAFRALTSGEPAEDAAGVEITAPGELGDEEPGDPPGQRFGNEWDEGPEAHRTTGDDRAADRVADAEEGLARESARATD